MRKGRLGVVLWLYPVAAFVAVIARAPWVCAAILAFTLAFEQDEWAVRQCIQALGLSLVTKFAMAAVTWVASLFAIPFISGFFAAAGGIVSALIYLAALIASLLAILRVIKDQEADLMPFSELAYRVYGKTRPRPLPGQAPGYYAPQENGEEPKEPKDE